MLLCTVGLTWLKQDRNNAEKGFALSALQTSNREVINMASYKQAIYNKCKECIYDPGGGNGKWKEQVEACTSYKCPLYELRPKSQKRHVGRVI